MQSVRVPETPRRERRRTSVMPRSNANRREIEEVFRKYGYNKFNDPRIREVRIKDKWFGGESLAVHPTPDGMTLWVRWGGQGRLGQMRANLGGDLNPKRDALAFPAGDLAELDEKLGRVVRWFESHRD